VARWYGRRERSEPPEREVPANLAGLIAAQAEGKRRAAAAAEAAAAPPTTPGPPAAPGGTRQLTTAEIAALALRQYEATRARGVDVESAAAPTTASAAEEQAPAAEGTRGAGMVIRLLPSEREAWHAAAKEAGYGKTARWVRDVVNAVTSGDRADPTRRAPRTVPPWVRQNLAAIGNNINQLAYRANAAAREGQPIGVLAEEVRAAKVELELLRLTLGADEG